MRIEEELIFLVAWPLLFMGLVAAVMGAKERQYRFSLRVMLVAVTLIAVWLGIVMSLYHTRR